MSLIGNLAGAILSGETDPKKLLLKIAQEYFIGDNSAQGLTSLKQKFDSAGLSEVVNSWIGKGTNLPINPQQIQAALGNETVQKLAAQAGFSTDQISSLLSELMPQMVDSHTPEGVIPV